MDETDRCVVEWTSPRSGLPMRCEFAYWHEGEHRCAGWWRDEDERRASQAGGNEHG